MNYLKHISYPELNLNRAENRNQNRISPEKNRPLEIMLLYME